jgi:UDP-N-acetylmuramoylalanine--D-glutamate ligase
MDDFVDMTVAVVGMARSGLAAAEALEGVGARVTLYDSGPADKLESAHEWAAEHGIDAHHSTDRVGEADLVVTSPGVRKSAPVLADACARGIPVWGEVEAAYRISKAPILAVTGTNGKTTTAALLGEMAKADGRETYVAGNIAAGEIAMPLISAAAQASHDALIVAEISSFQLEWTPSFRPRVSAILNITLDHLDRQTWDEYVSAKWSILAHQGPGDVAVMRSDCPRPAGYSRRADGPEIVVFDRQARPEWLDGVVLPGEHNIENVLAAMCMARAAGIGEAAVRNASTTFRGVVHRLEYVGTHGGVRYINNSMCTNNAAFARSLDAMPGSKVVIAGGVYKGGDMSDLVRAATGESVRRLVLFGRSASEIEAAVRGAGFERVDRVSGLAEALTAATQVAGAGDTVILNPGCASFDQFRDFEDRGDTFKRLVQALGPPE